MSNETLKPNPEKTKSAPKLTGRPKSWAVLLACALLVGLIVLLSGRASAPTLATLTVNPGSSNAKSYSLETVTTDTEQQQGLSGRSGLATDRGMLFTFPGEREERCIWMKDMKFTIDVLWLDRNKRIVSAIANLTPASYPQKYCASAAYIVELPAGTIRGQGLRTGQTVSL